MITGLHHATFITSDLARSRAFYEGVLGLQADAKRPVMSFEGVWYEVGTDQQIHLMLLPDPEAGLQRPRHGGRDRHVALVVKELAWLMSRLDVANIRYSVSQSGRRALFCRDPDQNALEFIEVVA
ncbi:MAG: Glyoxalase/bleomycin resistance protein/dioxygenase [Gallionellaceae bacterium]|nr:MAG: Glyoxalase/bleomycin resistance protein/dioxygenase [Gallionellaceae bacterium]